MPVVPSQMKAGDPRTDVAGLQPYGNSTLPSGIRSRIVTNFNGLAMHVLEAGSDTKRRHCTLLEGRRLLDAFELGHYWDTQVLGRS